MFIDGAYHILSHWQWKPVVWSSTQKVAEVTEREGESSLFAEVKAIQLALDNTEQEKWSVSNLYADSQMVTNVLQGWLQQWKQNWQCRGKHMWVASPWKDIAAWVESMVAKAHHVDVQILKILVTEEDQNNQRFQNNPGGLGC